MSKRKVHRIHTGIFGTKRNKRRPSMTFARKRALIKLPYKPTHMTEKAIREAVLAVGKR